MTMSMYQAMIPVCVRALGNLAHVLRQGEAHAKAKEIDPAIMLTTRLIPDMLPLVKQVQIATDTAKNGAARLAGTPMLRLEDHETSFEELQQRITTTLDYLKSFKPEQIDGSETRAITMATRSGEQHFEGETYLLHFVLPNMFFHCTMAYAILRQAGVSLGKRDFLGA